MTTRGQKKTNEVVASNTSDNATVIDMLTTDIVDQTTTQTSTNSQTVPALAKDVVKEKEKDTEVNSTLGLEPRKNTSPAKAKDGKHLIQWEDHSSIDDQSSLTALPFDNVIK